MRGLDSSIVSTQEHKSKGDDGDKRLGEEEGKMARERIMARLSHGSPTFTLKVDNGEGKLVLSQGFSLQNPSLVKLWGNSREDQLYSIGDPNNIDVQHQNLQARDNLNSQNFPFYDLSTLSAATDNFSDSNKLGQGGFGPVYKGQLPDGKEVAVKRLSSVSEQGLDEFTNEEACANELERESEYHQWNCKRNAISS
ncbi:hypothetical protein ACSBR1_016317 [Camellia fascicularis]